MGVVAAEVITEPVETTDPVIMPDPFRFIRRVSIRLNDEYEVDDNINIQLRDIYVKYRALSEEYIVLEHGEVTYTVDMNRIVVNENISLNMTVKELLEWMTEEVLYTYAITDYQNFENHLVSLVYGDFANLAQVTASNVEMEEDSPLLNDPGFPDIAVGIDQLDLNYMLPQFNGVLFLPAWSNSRIYIRGAANILLDNPETSLLTTSKPTEVRVVPVESVEQVTFKIDGFVPLLVIDGTIQLDSKKAFDFSKNEIRLSQISRDKLSALATELYDPFPRTFIIFFKGSRILKKKIHGTYIAPTVTEFAFHDKAVLTADAYGKLYPNMTSPFTVINGEKRFYCYTEIENPKIVSVVII